jgi:hypothetical protein
MNQSLKALLLIVAVLSFSACKKEITPENIKEIEGFDYGRVRNNTYTNTFFNIRMDVPKGWLVQDEEQKKELMEVGRKVSVEEDDETMKAAIKTSEITTANLFTAFAYEPGTVPFSHNMILLAENVSNTSIDITPEMYLENANKLLQSSKLDIIQIDNSYTKKTLNGMDFYEMNIVNHMQGLNIHQTYLVTIDKGFALGFIYSYIDDAQKAEIEKAINTLRPYRDKSAK